jgi:invasion protein IalB
LKFVLKNRTIRGLARLGLGLALMTAAGAGQAATSPAKKPPQPAPAATEGQHKADASASSPPSAAAPGWAARCSAAARQGPLECQIDENAVMNGTGQLVVGVTIRVQSETHAPLVLVHLPLGLYLPAGVKLEVDDAEAVSLALQTCDASGCFAGSPLAAGLLDQLKHGQQLKVTFQNLQHADIKVPLPLNDFAGSFAKIQ